MLTKDFYTGMIIQIEIWIVNNTRCVNEFEGKPLFDLLDKIAYLNKMLFYCKYRLSLK